MIECYDTQSLPWEPSQEPNGIEVDSTFVF